MSEEPEPTDLDKLRASELHLERSRAFSRELLCRIYRVQLLAAELKDDPRRKGLDGGLQRSLRRLLDAIDSLDLVD